MTPNMIVTFSSPYLENSLNLIGAKSAQVIFADKMYIIPDRHIYRSLNLILSKILVPLISYTCRYEFIPL